MDRSVLSMELGEAMFTQRSIRRMKPDPISPEHLRLLVEAAVKAPNGGNRQIGRFLLVTDRAAITEFGALYRSSWWAKRKDDRGWNGPEDAIDLDSSTASAMHFADEIKDVPALAFILSEPPHSDDSVLPAAQNLMLAARALGIGSVPTTLHRRDHQAFREMFGVPDDIALHLCIPLGYPRGGFSPPKRRPITETTHWDRWGGPLPQ